MSTELDEPIVSAPTKRRGTIIASALAALVALVVIIALATSSSPAKVHHHYNEQASFNAGFAEGVKLAKIPANIVMVSRGFSSPYSVCVAYKYTAAKSLDVQRWIRGCEHGFISINGN